MALATTDDVRRLLNLPAGQDEALLSALVGAASAFALAFMNLDTLEVKSYTERYNGTGSRTLCPNNYPIKTITNLKIDERTIPPAINGSDSGYRFNNFAIVLRGYCFTEDLLNVEVTYTAGFDTVPADINQAIVEIVAEKYQRRLRMGISSKTIGQESIAYSQNDMLPQTKLVLSQYRRGMLTT